MREIRGVHHGDSIEFKERVLVNHVACRLVVGNVKCLDLPYGCPGRIFFAKLAWRIDGLAEFSLLPSDPASAGSGNTGVVGKPDSHVFNNSVSQVARQFDPVRENHFACRFDQADVSRGGDGVLTSIVSYDIGQHRTFTLRKLDIARRDDDTEFLLVTQLVGFEYNRRVPMNARSGLRGGRRLEKQQCC